MSKPYNRGTKTAPNWWITWRENGQKKYQRIGLDKALASSVLKQKEGKIQAQKVSRRLGVQTEPLPPVPTFDAAADVFIARRSALDLDGKPMRRAWKKDQG